MNVVIFAGGISRERPVSYTSGREVAYALQRAGYAVTVVDPALGAAGVIETIDQMEAFLHHPPVQPVLARYLEAIALPVVQQADIVFLALHGRYGEDGTVQALLDIAGIPYTGSGVYASAVAIDKALSKRVFDSAGIPTPPWTLLSPNAAEDPALLAHLRTIYGDAFVFKPSEEGSTFGIRIVDNGDIAAMQDAIRFAAQFSNTIIAEQYIPGRELTVGILGDRALPVVEIVPKSGFYDYEHKYQKGKTEYYCPAPLDPAIAATVQRLALEAHYALQCEVFSRVDFRMDPRGLLFCLEVNTIPGLTPLSLLPKAAAAAGISFPELCTRIIHLSLNKRKQEL